MTYTEQFKRDVAHHALCNIARSIDYNATGYPVRFKLSAPLTATARTVNTDSAIVHSHPKAAYFHDACLPQLLPPTAEPCSAEPCLPARDATHDAEYAEARRTLIVPFDPVDYGTTVDAATGVPIATPWRVVEEDERRVTRVFVSEAHGVYIQQYRGWLPPSVVVFFPLAYEYVAEEQIVMRVHTVGFILSPNTELNQVLHSVTNAVKIQREGIPLLFDAKEDALNKLRRTPVSRVIRPPATPIWLQLRNGKFASKFAIAQTVYGFGPAVVPVAPTEATPAEVTPAPKARRLALDSEPAAKKRAHE
jgi:hypothetical protein